MLIDHYYHRCCYVHYVPVTKYVLTLEIRTRVASILPQLFMLIYHVCRKESIMFISSAQLEQDALSLDF